MKLSNRSLLFLILIFILIILAGIAIFIYYVDPSQLYHKHETYLGDQRYEIAGVAKNHNYDAAIIGTSMLMNHYPEQIDSLFGWKTKNMTLMGATHDEYDVLLPYLVKTGKAKNIILGLDLFSFTSELGAIPKELYDDNPFNDINYLLSYQGLKHSINYLKGGLPEKNLYHFESPNGKEHLAKSVKGVLKGAPKIYNFNKNQKDFDNHLLKHIKNAPKDIHWYVYLPPVSIGEFSIMYSQDQLDKALMLRKHILLSLDSLPNVTLFDFQMEPWITNLDEYMDNHHHSHKYNRDIIESIYRNEFVFNKDSIDFRNDRLRHLAPLYLDSLLKIPTN